MIKLRQRDNDIINFINNYGFLSIQQCANIFYTDNKMKYDEARKRLKKLYDNKLLHRLFIDNNKIVYTSNHKFVNWHRYLLIQFYSLLCQYGKINTFITEYQFTDMGIRPDGFFELIFNNQLISMFVEIDYSHNTELDRYEKLYKDGRIQEYYKDRYGKVIFPEVVVVKKNIPKNLLYSNNYKIIYLDFTFNDFSKVLL